jgi:hypothetical protein
MRTAPKSLGQAMYVASKLDESWLQNVQRKLYGRSRDNPGYVFSKLWGLITDPHNLRRAFARVARNKGRRAAGIDRVTVGQAKPGTFRPLGIPTVKVRVVAETHALCMVIYGEPCAYRKVHAGFGRGRPETPRRKPGSALDAYLTAHQRACGGLP